VIGQLRGYCDQLKAIEGTLIGSVDRTYCEDRLFTDELGAYGPYENETEFNAGLIKALKNSLKNPWTEKVCEMINAVLKGHRIVLTHGDLAPRNILVNGPTVVAIFDWEEAGFSLSVGSTLRPSREEHRRKGGSRITQLTISWTHIWPSWLSCCTREI
jgi:hypothetical protein